MSFRVKFSSRLINRGLLAAAGDERPDEETGDPVDTPARTRLRSEYTALFAHELALADLEAQQAIGRGAPAAARIGRGLPMRPLLAHLAESRSAAA